MSHQALTAVHIVMPYQSQEVEAATPYAREILPRPFIANEHRDALRNVPLQTAVPRWRDSLALSELNRPPSWWETEAVKILHSDEHRLISQVFHWHLYGTTENLNQTLRQLQTAKLDNILSLLQHGQAFDGNRVYKASKIIELAGSRRHLPSPVSAWQPRPASRGPVEIGDEIDKESRSMFEQVDFAAWVRYALGYEEEAVRRLFAQHGCISVRIRWYLESHPKERPSYNRVSEVGHLGTSNPIFADTESTCKPRVRWLIKRWQWVSYGLKTLWT